VAAAHGPGRRGLLGAAGAAAFAPPPAAAQTGDEPLREIAARRGVAFGCVVHSRWLHRNRALAGIVAREAAMLVPEGDGKWWELRPDEATFDFTGLDGIFAFAARHGQSVRGHTLVWDTAMRDWTLAALEQGPARAQALLEAHLDGVLGHTAPVIRDWDVANEVIADPWKSDELLKDSPWLRTLGPGYIDLAYRLARRRDPGLVLTYNDYGCEHDTAYDDEKRRRVLALVRGMKDRGVPLDAVGLQGHLHRDAAFSAAKVTEFIGALRALDLRVIVTELDVIEPEAQSDLAAREARSAALLHAFVSTVLEAGVRAVLCWDLADPADGTGGGPPSPPRLLPLDAVLRRTPIWGALARALEGRPWP
jgi:endo-1,4-beta-xylanase